jgi:hypothetical protein
MNPLDISQTKLLDINFTPSSNSYSKVIICQKLNGKERKNAARIEHHKSTFGRQKKRMKGVKKMDAISSKNSNPLYCIQTNSSTNR